MAWNYRGYGKTRSLPTPYNIKTDGESMLNFMFDHLMLEGKVGIYGRSLGGVVASHLAATFPEKVDFLLADRTFGTLKSISTRKFIGSGTNALYDIISMRWETNNDINFLKVNLSLNNT
jgi:pimeloyl-ACP methyl ester carboxylesterase